MPNGRPEPNDVMPIFRKDGIQIENIDWSVIIDRHKASKPFMKESQNKDIFLSYLQNPHWARKNHVVLLPTRISLWGWSKYFVGAEINGMSHRITIKTIN